jgi:hypothetical protein
MTNSFLCVLQKKLNRLIDDGIVRPGELDNMTLDALEGEGC